MVGGSRLWVVGGSRVWVVGEVEVGRGVRDRSGSGG